MSVKETVKEIDAMISRLSDTDDIEAVPYIGALDMLRDLWLDGGTNADVAAEKFHEICKDFLEEWVKEREA
jgi:hypothetical protein